MDYQNLAQQAGQAAGASPFTAPGFVTSNLDEISRYNQMQQLRDQALQGGAQEAQLNLQSLQRKGQVESEQLPGLLTQAQIANQRAKTTQGLLPQEAEELRLTLEKRTGDLQAAIDSGKLDSLKSTGNAYYEANSIKDPQKRQAAIDGVVEAARGFKIPTESGFYVMGTDRHKDEQLLFTAGLAQSSPNIRWHLPTEEVRAESRQNVATIAGMNQQQVAQMKIDAQSNLERLKAELKANKPINAFKPEDQAILMNYGRQDENGVWHLTDPEGALKFSLTKAAASQIATGTASAGTARNIGVNGVEAPTAAPVPVPNVPAANKAAPATAPTSKKYSNVPAPADPNKIGVYTDRRSGIQLMWDGKNWQDVNK
jgi:hypothetical protein